MKKVIGDILNKEEVPKDLKEKLIQTAKFQLLARDLTSLFSINTPKSALDILKTISKSNQKNKKS